MWIIAWIVLSIICGMLGSERSIGGTAAFFIALLLSPIVGFLVVLAAERKSKPAPHQQGNKWESLIEEAEIEKYKGNIEKAIDKYKEAQFHLDKYAAAIKDPGIRWKYTERLDGLRLIVKKLEQEKCD